MFSKLSKREFALNHFRLGWKVPSEWKSLLSKEEMTSMNFISHQNALSWRNILRQPKVLKAYRDRIGELS